MLNRCNFCGNLFIKKYKCSDVFSQLICQKCANTILKKKQITLGIGILHYRESDEMLFRALKSIDSQRGINFDNIKVIVVTDGNGKQINEKNLKQLLHHIKPTFYYKSENQLAGGTRNTIIDLLITDYIMFIDCDDQLISRHTLSHMYKKIINYRPDVYCSGVKEQVSDLSYITYKNLMCLNMCHGKIYKRDFLISNHIQFNTKMKIAEDTLFNLCIYDICDNIYYDNNFISYQWNYNNNSITHKDSDFTYLDSYFRCFDDVLKCLNDWYFKLSSTNKFVNNNFISAMYNIFYYRIKLSNLSEYVENYFLTRFFSYVKGQFLNIQFINKLDKTLNKHLLKKIEYFNEARIKYIS